MQGTKEWFDARIGKVTGSRFADVLSGRLKMTKACESYMMELCAERLTGRATPEFSSKPTEWGKANEAEARQMYVINSGEVLKEVMFIDHPLLPWVGCSPDALVGFDGILEIKCPYNTTNHLQTILNGKVPDEYEAQVHGNMWVTGRKWCDYVSFDPRVKDVGLSFFVLRVERDDNYIEDIAEAVQRFLSQLDIRMGKLTKIGEEMRQAWGLE